MTDYIINPDNNNPNLTDIEMNNYRGRNFKAINNHPFTQEYF